MTAAAMNPNIAAKTYPIQALPPETAKTNTMRTGRQQAAPHAHLGAENA
jgi:hypothetical protein